MIKLLDLIHLAGVELSDFKIHCATGKHPSHPLQAFFDGTFQQWQEDQTQKNFECAEILSLILLEQSDWLFAGLYHVEGVAPDGNRYRYQTVPVPELDHLTGRAIVRFEKNFRASYLKGNRYGNQLLVSSLRSERMTVGDFPGFNAVLLSFPMLKTIVRQQNPSWKAALANVAGVYVIVDTVTGRQYVGSAYGGIGIWQRWSSYAQNGHGSNVELRQLLNEQGKNYCLNWQIALLEVCDINAGSEFVIERETYWKQVLCSREFGMNRN